MASEAAGSDGAGGAPVGPKVVGRAPRGWYHGWNIIAVGILAQIACNGLTINTFSLFLRDWAAEFHTSISSLQLAPAAMGLASSVFAAFIGGLADTKPARWLFAIGLAGLAVFYTVLSFANAPWQIVALYGSLLPLGVIFSGALTANALVSRWFVRRLGLALGLTAFGTGIAGVILPPIIAALAPAVGWRWIWRGAGLIIALVFIPLALTVFRDRPGAEEGAFYLSGASTGKRPLIHGAAGSSLSWRTVFARRNFWLLVAVYLPILGIYGGSAQNLTPIVALHGMGRPVASLLLSMLSLSYVVSTLVLGVVSDRFGNRVPFMGLATTSATGAFLLAFGHSLPTATAGAILVGAGGGLFPLLASGIAAEFGAEGFGRAFGLAMAFVPLISLSPFSIAKSQEMLGSYAPALVGLGLLALTCGAVSLLFRERHGGHATQDEKAAIIEAGAPLA